MILFLKKKLSAMQRSDRYLRLQESEILQDLMFLTDIWRGCKVRISREGKQIFEGDLASLKRFKDDVKEVKTGYECGLVFDGFNDIAEFDVVEAYKMVEVPR